MEISDLQACDPSLKLLWPESYKVPIETLGALGKSSVLASRHLYFAGSESYRKTMEKKLEKSSPEDVGCVFAKGMGDLAKLRGKLAYMLEAEDVPLSMSLLSRPFYDRQMAGVNDEVDGRQMGSAEVDPSANIAQGVFLGAGVKVGARALLYPGVVALSGSVIGEDSVLYPNVTLCRNTHLGRGVRIHAGTVIGADGFGFNTKGGEHHKVWHIGNVIIGDDVEIGANSSVDRGTFGSTIVQEGCKLDNFVHIGHNCHIGRGVIMCGQSAVGGSSVVGDFCVFAGRAGVSDNVILGDNCQLAAGATAISDWPSGSVLGGHPARPLREWLKGVAKVRALVRSTSATKGG